MRKLASTPKQDRNYSGAVTVQGLFLPNNEEFRVQTSFTNDEF